MKKTSMTKAARKPKEVVEVKKSSVEPDDQILDKVLEAFGITDAEKLTIILDDIEAVIRDQTGSVRAALNAARASIAHAIRLIG